MTMLDRLRAVGTAGRMVAGTLTVSLAGAGFIIGHEGTVPEVYLDPVGIPTVCTGHTSTVGHEDLGTTFSDEVCAYLLEQDLRDSEEAVKNLVTQPITQAQYDALVSFTFNVGGANFARSTLLRRLNSGQCEAAASEFNRWVYAKGRKLPGLVRRRSEESILFATGCKETT